MDERIGVMLHRASQLNVGGLNTSKLITFNATLYNDSTDYFTVDSNGAITVVESGIYVINGRLDITSGTLNYMYLRVYALIDGVNILVSSSPLKTVATYGVHLFDVITLPAGAVLTLYLMKPASATKYAGADWDGLRTSLAVLKLG